MQHQKRAENQAEALKVQKEMASAKTRMEVYLSHDEVNAEEGSMPPPMKGDSLEFGRLLREDGKYSQKEIVQFEEENLCSRLPILSNSRDVYEGQMAMKQSKEVWQEV